MMPSIHTPAGDRRLEVGVQPDHAGQLRAVAAVLQQLTLVFLVLRTPSPIK